MRALRAEWVLLRRARLWVVLGLTTAAFTALATGLVIASADPTSAGDIGITTASLNGPGGATAAVVSSVAFSAILVLAAFASSTGNEFGRGTMRVALTRQPRRLALLGGKLVARLGVAVVAMVLAMVVGAITAAIVAPGQGVDTAGWFGGEAAVQAAGDLARLIGFVTFYALVGTTIAALVRSTPVALGIGLVWFGPIENVIGEDQSWAYRWFPGLLLRSVLTPDAPDSIATGTAVATLVAYAVAIVAVLAFVTARRDVTAS